jgi:hypothetical protein
MKGRPLQELIKESNKSWPQEVFIQISGFRVRIGRAIRTKRWKYSIKNPEKSGFLYAKSDKYVEDELYDLKNDPFEKNNLIENPDYQHIRTKLSEILKRKMKKAGELVPQIIPKIK